ncbi:DUF2182 domain-containing protein [Hymenobacter monticola]|uniref:DUF2182 domain-containing protein n=1 Tax=Hymenobacter monticola TaxID=1705399 RepID=A0ABY4B8B3_9BACT|nr:DUF2182 domain-containing protein [Hymenobacter monticola]UOE34979.1 DUF2182 domain-containing protein [Hymenobacter monticola]
MATPAWEYAWLRSAVFGLSLCAWLAVLWPVLAGQEAGAEHLAISYCGAPVPVPSFATYAPSGELLASVTPLSPGLTWAWAGNWALMLVAMMLPTLVAPLCHVHSRSFARRRARAMSLFVLGYGAVWLVVGSGLLGLQRLVQGWFANPYLLAGAAVLLALVWQASPLKQRFLNRGHRHRALAAFGVRADADALRLGLEHGGWCAASCWALMLVPPLLPSGHLWAMAAVGLLMYCERLDPPGQPAWRWRGFKTAVGFARLRLLGPRRFLHTELVSMR